MSEKNYIERHAENIKKCAGIQNDSLSNRVLEAHAEIIKDINKPKEQEELVNKIAQLVLDRLEIKVNVDNINLKEIIQKGLKQ